MSRSLPLIAVALLFVVVPLAPAQESQRLSRAINDLEVYRALVIDYHAGHDEAVGELLKWDRKRLIAGLKLLGPPSDKAIANFNRLSANAWPDATLRAASMMHTDAAIRCLDDGDDEGAFFHLGIATDHVQRGRNSVAGFEGRWIFAVSRLMRSRGRDQDAERLLEKGRTLLPTDPIVLYESGLLQEMFATQWGTMVSARMRTAGDLTRWDSILSTKRRARLDKAEAWLRGSVGLAPSNTMGRLHLGRVLMMRGSNDEALQLLRKVFDQPDDRAAAYLAALFAGAVHERDGRLEAAADAYRQAIDRFVRGHTAYMALSEVLQRAGHGDRAREVLQQLLNEEPDARREPWSWYFIELPKITIERFDDLRAEARR